jgi:hypothetical protein
MRRIARCRVRAAAWRARRWWERWPLERVALERAIPPEYSHFERRVVGKALVYNGTVQLDTIGIDRTLALIFPGRPSRIAPIVMADGPTKSRHRFYWSRPSSLCLWYSGDPASMRWTIRDGLGALIDLSRIHLVKETYWRVTGTWSEHERHGEPPRGNEQRARDLTPTRVDRVRRERQPCWCGSRRYSTCHGALDTHEELEALGLSQGAQPRTRRAPMSGAEGSSFDERYRREGGAHPLFCSNFRDTPG